LRKIEGKESMKKLGTVVSVLALVLILSGASVWEGAAAISLNGELPDGGFYAATKSFPRNTVVDVTNLETGKTIRVIVAAGLESPGLLAILSREAAESIGMQAWSIGRIRMTMPSDPVAFSRFTESLSPSGDPDFDPQAAIAAVPPQAERTLELPVQAEESVPRTSDTGSAWAEPALIEPRPANPVLIDPVPPGPAVEPIVNEPAVTRSEIPRPSLVEPVITESLPVRSAEPTPAASDAIAAPAPIGPTMFDPTLPEPVFSRAEAQNYDTPGPGVAISEEPPEDPSVVDIDLYEPPRAARQDNAISSVPAPVLSAGDRPEEIPVQAPRTAQSGPEVWEPAAIPQSEIVLDEPAWNFQRSAEPVPAARGPAAIAREPEKPPLEEPALAVSEPVKPPVTEPSPRGQYDFSLVPAEARPPEGDNLSLPPEAEIRPIPGTGLTDGRETGAREVPEVIDRSRIIEPIDAPKTGNTPAASAPAVASAAPRPAGTLFSVPVINSLEKGKYYLQLGAFNKAESVESELSRIGQTYPLTVQAGGSPDKPLYRILVGPVNLGESGALLQRFKVSGYQDAFIRQDG
jgi:hypothetical protein